MGRGGYREGAGRKSAFPGKILDHPFAMDFTPAGRKVLQTITVREGLSRNDVLAHLAIKHAHNLEFDEDGVVFPGKAQDVLAIRLPREAGDALRSAQARTGKSYSDLGEALVVRFGVKEHDYPLLPGKEPPRRRRRVARRHAQ